MLKTEFRERKWKEEKQEGWGIHHQMVASSSRDLNIERLKATDYYDDKKKEAERKVKRNNRKKKQKVELVCDLCEVKKSKSIVSIKTYWHHIYGIPMAKCQSVDWSEADKACTP